MVVPSCSVCVVCELAIAENGAPLTTFPPCKPSKPSNSMRSPNGAPGPPPPGPSPWYSNAGGGSGSCALNIPAPSNTALPTSEQAQLLRFIVSSPLLSRASKLISTESKHALLRLRQPHRFGQPVLAHQQINLNPIAHALFIHRQTERAQRAALHPYPHDRGIIHLLPQASPPQSKTAHGVIGDDGRPANP